MKNKNGARIRHQKLPATGKKREALRQKGQFWTPAWVAEAMTAYVLGCGSDHILDPAVGEGAFFRAGKVVARELNRRVELLGAEIDSAAIEKARHSGLTDVDLSGVRIIDDFVLSPPDRRYRAIVANPPYIRHHRLPPDTKANLKKFGKEVIGTALDGRAGFHIYFLLRALTLLEEGGRLSFIMPADTCEGKFAPLLWKWITDNYRLAAVLTFKHDASPFPGIDTNPIVFFIENGRPKTDFLWAICTTPDTNQLKQWTLSGFKQPSDAISVQERSIDEGIATGLSRPRAENQADSLTLADFAKVMRGIATGANEYFFLTKKQAADLGLPQEFLLPAVGRTRDVTGGEITEETMRVLDESGRPTLLFSPNGKAPDTFPIAMREYLKQGEALGLPKRSLIATRNPWYKMETRSAPPILFAYLGRRNARFIRNYAGVLPLTGFLCIYPHINDTLYIEQLWRVLKHPDTVKNLSRVGKSYGAGAIKVEPRGLEQLPLPRDVVAENGLLEQVLNSSRKKQSGIQGELFAA